MSGEQGEAGAALLLRTRDGEGGGGGGLRVVSGGEGLVLVAGYPRSYQQGRVNAGRWAEVCCKAEGVARGSMINVTRGLPCCQGL